jgi:hypothetical protein
MRFLVEKQHGRLPHHRIGVFERVKQRARSFGTAADDKAFRRSHAHGTLWYFCAARRRNNAGTST